MKTLLAVSPHLDDAVFSAGAELARRAAAGWRVVVATCFTGNVERPTGFALACQLDKGLGPDVDYMALRRAEDVAACAEIGVAHVHLPFREAPHRGYGSAAALFGDPLDEPLVEAELKATLETLARDLSPAEIMAPAAIGGHVDHRLVLRVVERVAAVPVTLWADFPYATRTAWPRAGFTPRPCGAQLPVKREAALCYASQLGFQFAGMETINPALQIDGAELFCPTASARG